MGRNLPSPSFALENYAMGRLIQLRSILTCPACGEAREKVMPENACVYFFECPACSVVIRPKPGDCCVFCSYGDTPCPPVQREENCCSG